MSKIYVETKNLILRELMPSDAEGMFELDSDPLVHRYLGNSPVKSIEASQTAIENIRQQYVERGIGRWAAIEKSSGDFIGWSGLKLNTEQEFNNKIDFYDIGYRFIPRYWGKGYATESAVASLDYAFNTLNLKTVVGMAEIENLASNRILQKIGLNYIEDFLFEDVMVSWYELSK
jgi:RimJ/RimL family protein N-acetyltransferase